MLIHITHEVGLVDSLWGLRCFNRIQPRFCGWPDLFTLSPIERGRGFRILQTASNCYNFLSSFQTAATKRWWELYWIMGPVTKEQHEKFAAQLLLPPFLWCQKKKKKGKKKKKEIKKERKSQPSGNPKTTAVVFIHPSMFPLAYCFK